VLRERPALPAQADLKGLRAPRERQVRRARLERTEHRDRQAPPENRAQPVRPVRMVHRVPPVPRVRRDRKAPSATKVRPGRKGLRGPMVPPGRKDHPVPKDPLGPKDPLARKAPRVCPAQTAHRGHKVPPVRRGPPDPRVPRAPKVPRERQDSPCGSAFRRPARPSLSTRFRPSRRPAPAAGRLSVAGGTQRRARPTCSSRAPRRMAPRGPYAGNTATSRREHSLSTPSAPRLPDVARLTSASPRVQPHRPPQPHPPCLRSPEGQARILA
jgi:hypothetical protein